MEQTEPTLRRLLPISRLAELCNPIGADIWPCGPVSKAMITEALAKKRYQKLPLRTTGAKRHSKKAHAQRIAFLVVNNWRDPVSLDVGVPSLGFIPKWPISDGNHRIAAAIYRGDTTVEAELEGQLDYIDEIFGPPKPSAR